MRNGDEEEFNKVIFNDFVIDNEKELMVNLEVHEIDQDHRYGIYEKPWKGKAKDYDFVGASSVKVPLEVGTYSFSNTNYSYDLKVELDNYDFPLLDEEEKNSRDKGIE